MKCRNLLICVLIALFLVVPALAVQNYQITWANLTGDYEDSLYLSGEANNTTLRFYGVIYETSTAGSWWDVSYSNRKQININNTGANLTDYQMVFNVTYDSDMQTNFNDVRFLSNCSALATLLPYRLEKYNASANATFLVNVSFIGNVSNTTLCMYYGNAAVGNISNGFQTFPFFDDFNDGDYINGTSWLPDGSSQWSASNNYLAYSSGVQAHISANSTNTIGIWEWDMKAVRSGAGYDCRFFYMSSGTETESGNQYRFLNWGNYPSLWHEFIGGSSTQIGSASLGTDTNWHKYKVIRNATGYQWFYYDDALIMQSASAGVTSSSYIIFYGFTTTDAIDNLRFRKYASPEPTSSFGEESSFSLETGNYTINTSESHHINVTFNNNNSTSQVFQKNNTQTPFSFEWLNAPGTTSILFTPDFSTNTTTRYFAVMNMELLNVAIGVNDHFGYVWKNSTVINSSQTYYQITFSRRAVDYYKQVYVNGTLQNTTNYSTSHDNDTITVTVNGLTVNQSYAINILIDFRILGMRVTDESTGSWLTATLTSVEKGISKSSSSTRAYFNGTEVENIWDGDSYARINASASGYASRFYTFYLDEYTDFTGALVAETAGAYFTFQTIDSASGNILSDIQVTVYKYADGTLVEQGFTDAAGNIRFFLSPTTQYRIVFTDPDAVYNTLVLPQIIPSMTPYMIAMTTTTILQIPSSDLIAYLLPAVGSLSNTSAEAISLFASSANCSITTMGLNTSNSTTSQYNTSTSGCGGTIAHIWNLSNATYGSFINATGVITYLDSLGNPQVWTVERSYVVFPVGYNASQAQNQTSIAGMILKARQGYSPFFLAMACLFISFFITMLVSQRVPVGLMGGGIIFNMILAILTIYGVFDARLLVMSVISSGGVILWKRS